MELTAQQKINRIGEIAKTVMQLAGEGWSMEPTQFPESIMLAHSGGARVAIRLSMTNGRGMAAPVPPVGIDGYVRDLVEWRVAERNEDMTFTFDIARPIPTISKSIVTRVIEPYASAFSMIEVSKQEEQNRWSKTANVAYAFATILGDPQTMGQPVQTLTIHPKRPDLSLPRVEADFRYWNESASLKIDCSLQQALDIAELISKMGKENPTNERNN